MVTRPGADTDQSAADTPQATRRLADSLHLPRRPKQERSRRKQEHLLDAAERLFAERGYEAVTADEIAAAAGYGTGTFYNYFANKTQAFVMVADRHQQAVIPALAAVADALERGADLREAIREIVTVIVTDRIAVPWLRRTWLRLVLTSSEVEEVQRSVDRLWGADLTALIAAGVEIGALKPVDAGAMASVVRILVDSVADEVAVRRTIEPPAAIDAVCALLEASLTGGEGGQAVVSIGESPQ